MVNALEGPHVKWGKGETKVEVGKSVEEWDRVERDDLSLMEATA